MKETDTPANQTSSEHAILSVLRLESLELRRLKADLIMCFKILKGFTNVIPSEFFTRSTCNTRGHSMKLYYPDCRVLARQNFFLCSRGSSVE